MKKLAPISGHAHILILLLVTLWFQYSGAYAATASRPNFLFIFTDDQQWDAMSVVQREQGAAARFPWIKTPNMDRIAAEGVRFRNAFVVNSLCSPSRASFLTGRYSHLNGVANNHSALPDNSVTYATQLRTAGYMTGYIGKFHMGNQSGQRPGFEYSASFVGQGRYHDCPFEINGTSTPTKGWVDDVSTDFALEFLKKHQAKPFMLSVGFKSSHGPWEPATRLAERYKDDVAKPAINAGSPPIYHSGAGALADTPAQKKSPAASAGKTEMIRNYMRVLTGVDENLGRILALLDELKLTENTVLIYTTDNGYYLGEHSLGDKRSAYEESLRIPFLVRYPKLGMKDKTTDQIVLNIDLAPTLLDFAGVSIPKEMQGASWRPLLEGKKVDWRKSFFYEYFYERGYEGTPTVLALRTESAKLIQYPGHDQWRELFDIQSDPHEMNNLARDPAQKEFLNQMIANFDRTAAALGFVVPEYADKPGDVNPRKAAKAAKAGKRQNLTTTANSRSASELVLDYHFNNDNGPRIADASGKNNVGSDHGTTVADGSNGKARHFDGKTFIDVPKSASLDCAESPWTIEAVVNSESPNGVILARGGQSLGYALYLDAGRPVFYVNTGKPVKCVGQPLTTGQWIHLAGVIAKDQSIRLYVNGAEVARTQTSSFFARDPNDSMQIGADTGSPVTSYAGEGHFVGNISLVRIYNGEQSVESIRKAAEAK